MSDKPTGRDTGSRSAGRCSICGNPVAPQYRPFCSRRCADVDLSRWLCGVYAIPTADADADEDGEDVAQAQPRQKGENG